MKIAIVGTGNMGGALARALARVGYRVYVGIRESREAKIVALESYHENISTHAIEELGELADIFIFCTVPPAITDVCSRIGPLHKKIIVDTMNSVHSHPETHKNTFEALSHIYPSCHVVKAFNTTGFENILHPNFGGISIDTFMAGRDKHSKDVVRKLAKDIGFSECYDFGGVEEVALLEDFAKVWINLALFQGQGRNIAFKLLKRG